MITIIGILIALLLPAVQAAREAGASCNAEQRQATCPRLPAARKSHAGRGPPAAGDLPGRAMPIVATTGASRAGGSTILPYIEQQALHDLGTGMGPNPPVRRTVGACNFRKHLDCPTRRKPNVYPWFTGITYAPVANGGDISQAVAQRLPTANGGDHYTDTSTGVYYGPQPTWFSAHRTALAGPSNVGQVENPAGNMTAAARNVFTYIASLTTGVSYCGSMIKMADISDGTSNTYFLGARNTSTPIIFSPARTVATTKACCAATTRTVLASPIRPSHSRPCRTRRAWPGGATPFSAAPHRRIPDGLLRRLREDDELLDRIRDPPPPGATARTA